MPARNPDRPTRDCQCTTVRHQHGTNTAYVTDRCRCDPCTRAMRRYNKSKRLRGIPSYVDATNARNHIRHLVDGVGVTIIGVSKATGLNASTIRLIYQGQPKASRGTYHRIMSTTLDNFPGECLVSGRGTVRRVQALHHLGYGVATIEKATGVCIKHLMANNTRRIDMRGYRAVARFYEEHAWSGPRPAVSVTERSAATRARKMAVARGWAPPGAWDDIDLDKRPHGVAVAA